MRSLQKLLAVVPFFALACSSPDVVDDSPAAVQDAVKSSFGATAETDEAPAFDDADLSAMAEDATAADTATDGRPDLASARRVRIAIVWGYLRPHPDATVAVDWTGSIKAQNAALRVIRKLRFEPHDLVIRPRTDVSTVEFESHTKPHADGLLLEVIMAPALNPSNGDVTLTFTSAPFTKTLTLHAGMRLTGAEKVDEAGHVVAYHIFRPDADSCREGLLRGEWKTTGEVGGHAVGVLKGRFVTSEGLIRGTLRGVFGTRPNGHQVWFAKVVDKDGNFLGVLAGRFGEERFAGVYLGKGRKVIGVVHGVMSEANENGVGGFQGRYSERCGERPDEGTAAASDELDIALDDTAGIGGGE